MNLNHLKYFFDSATAQSLSRAAQQNRVSQSAISQAIRSIENSLDCSLIEHKRNRFQDWVLNRDVDFGLIADTRVSSLMHSIEMMSGAYRIFAAPHSKLTIRTHGIIVTRTERPEVKSLIRAYKRKANADLGIHMEVTSWEVIKVLVLAEIGLGLCPDYVIEQEVAAQRLQIIDIKGFNFNYRIDAVYLKYRTPSRAAQAIIDHCSYSPIA